jgi:hypothetical protein
MLGLPELPELPVKNNKGAVRRPFTIILNSKLALCLLSRKRIKAEERTPETAGAASLDRRLSLAHTV